jgi:hypothetical protein
VTYGCDGDLGTRLTIPSFDLDPEEHITEVITYEADRTIKNSADSPYVATLIVGISFKTDWNRNDTFGSQNGTERKETFKDYSLGFVYGKSGGYVDCLRFVWYKYCSKNSLVFE